jgi:TrmH family RNA methyltransferase
MSILRSRDNPRVKRWAKLVEDGRFRRSEKRVLVEGPHLVGAVLGDRTLELLVSESGTENREIQALMKLSGKTAVVLSDAVFGSVVDAETPQGIAAEIALPAGPAPGHRTCVFLEGVQDAGNVGAIIRTAAAFGAGAVILDRKSADPWSPKVLRAGMGGHFVLQVGSVQDLAQELGRFPGRLACTVPRGGQDLRRADLSGRIGWVFGSEGRGVSEAVLAEADLRITIETALESLNVAATAAICLFSTPGGGS